MHLSIHRAHHLPSHINLIATPNIIQIPGNNYNFEFTKPVFVTAMGTESVKKINLKLIKFSKAF